jgi:hypothetical protein
MLFGMTGLQQRREQNGLLLLLMMLVSKGLEKLENAIHIAIIHVFTVRHTVGHFANDIKGPKDVLMLFHQDPCGFHGGLLSSPLIRASGVPEFRSLNSVTWPQAEFVFRRNCKLCRLSVFRGDKLAGKPGGPNHNKGGLFQNYEGSLKMLVTRGGIRRSKSPNARIQRRVSRG